MTYYFDIQLNVGNQGEVKFASQFKAEKSQVYAYDFILGGKTVEVKTDSYDSPNFFMEFYSDAGRKTPGGPFRAAKDKVDLFVYYFPKKAKFYFFKSQELADHLTENLAKFKKREIPNKHKTSEWTTQGYLVPIQSIAHLAEIKEEETV
jgi:hypothetical protein